MGAANAACGMANALAAGVRLPYIQANATAHVTTQSLGFLSTGMHALDPIVPPVNGSVPSLIPVDIPIT